jgi:oligopeptide/dipeptide ABC transporter ATP-binding protein
MTALPLLTDDPRASSSALLEVRDLSVRIGHHDVLSGVDLSVGAGRCLGLVGETGSGKTLTCRALIGLLPRIGAEVTHGSITFDGRDLVPFRQRAWHRLRGREIAFVPQSSLTGLDPVMTVGRQLAETIRLLDPEAEVRRRAVELLDMVEMPNPQQTLTRYPHQLSGGMRQRAMIALAIVGRPKLLLADEPTTALDVTVQRAILDLLTTLRRATHMSLIIVTHDLGVVETVTDDVAIMYAGSTIETGATKDVLSRPQHPYTRALLDARPSARAEGARLTTIPGQPPGPGEWADGCRYAPRCPFVQDRCHEHVPQLTAIPHGHPAACLRQEELVHD